MLQLDNRSALPAALLALPDPDGVDSLHVIVKATFALTPTGELAKGQRPLALADVTEGEGESAWLRFPSEAHPPKSATEVLLDGHAVAPGGRAAGAVDVRLAVGAWRRSLRVFGDRRYTGEAATFATAPEPFERMPLTPRRAFGGRFDATGEVDAHNPAGVGLVPPGTRDLRALRGLSLPNVEDPIALIGRPGDRPAPALVTPVGAAWQPRAAWAGTYDDVWDRTRAPFLPTDFDARFLQVAAPSMWLTARLRGGESIALTHVADAPSLESRVPTLGLRVRAWFRGAAVELPAHAETLHLLPDDGVGTLLLRATLRCGHRLLDVALVEVSLQGRR